MNIFFLDENPELAAQYHMDKHVVKMPLEMAQMLCTNIYILNGLTSRTQSAKKENYVSVLKMFHGFPPRENAVYPFYLFAFPSHPCTIWLRNSQAMPENYMNENPVIAYRNYYTGDKRHIAKWKNREEPSWWI